MQQNCRKCLFGKDTMTGHWGKSWVSILLNLLTFLERFPEEISPNLKNFQAVKVIREANKPYSGTAVIEDFWTSSNGNQVN